MGFPVLFCVNLVTFKQSFYNVQSFLLCQNKVCLLCQKLNYIGKKDYF